MTEPERHGRERRERWGFELPLLLFAGFRSLIDQLHAELADHGHPDLRPAYGFAMQAIGRDGVTASELGRRLSRHRKVNATHAMAHSRSTMSANW